MCSLHTLSLSLSLSLSLKMYKKKKNLNNKTQHSAFKVSWGVLVKVLQSDDYNATRVQYITLISHTGAQWYHN